MSYIPERLENEAQVPAMLKCSLKTNEMLFVFQITLSQLLKNLYFLQAGFVPVECD